MPPPNEKDQGESLPGLSELEWIQLREDISESPKDRSLAPKFKDKVKENPFVPLGLVATTFCLGYGLYTMTTGDTRKSQIMMRARVVSQGLTVVALLGGVAYLAQKKQ